MQKKKGISLTVLIVIILIIITLITTGVVLLIPKETPDNNINSNEIPSENVEVKAGNWKQEGNQVTNGKQTIQIGDFVEYTASGTDYEGKWAVLGVENGNILIVSIDNVIQNYNFGLTEKYVPIEQLQNVWLTGPEKLNESCIPYGKGKGAISARSLNAEDLNKLLGYIPEDYYGKGDIGEYGAKVTFSWNDDFKIKYAVSNGTKETSNTKYEDGFCYYNGNEFVNNTTFAGEIVTIENTYYYFNAYTYKLGKLDNLMAMYILMKDESLLASTYVTTHKLEIPYGFLTTQNLSVEGLGIFDADYYPTRLNILLETPKGVRAVVTLNSKIDFVTSETTEINATTIWKIK